MLNLWGHPDLRMLALQLLHMLEAAVGIALTHVERLEVTRVNQCINIVSHDSHLTLIGRVSASGGPCPPP